MSSKLAYLLLFTLFTVSLCNISIVKRSEDDHDDHDGHDDHDDHEEHEEHHSEVEECEDHLWCVDSTTYVAKCYTDKAQFCECLDGASATYNTETKKCESIARTYCDDFRPERFAFYGGTCYNEVNCKAKSAEDKPWKWIQKEHNAAKCAPLRYMCGSVEGTEWDDASHACTCIEKGAEFHGDHCHGKAKTVSVSAKWGYGIIATAIISSFSVFGVMIVLFRHQWWYKLLLSTMVALAMGCLLADATLHLIPLSLGLHSHDDGDSHGHAEKEPEMSATDRRNITIAITLGIYLFLIFEKAIHLIMPHGHSHGDDVTVIKNMAADGTELKEVNSGKELSEDVVGVSNGICNVGSVAWMVIIAGDGLHNFADGLVMGAAFTNSLATGLGTSIAVFCHEVPHELGDFAVLLNAGMKVRWAVLFNFLSACSCFLGLFVGLAIGENEAAQKWIFAFTAGMFIYIACADLMPLMQQTIDNCKNPILFTVFQHIGIWVGFIIMFLLAMFEAQIESIQSDSHDNH